LKYVLLFTVKHYLYQNVDRHSISHERDYRIAQLQCFWI